MALRQARKDDIPEDLLEETEREVKALQEKLEPLEKRMDELLKEIAEKNERFINERKQQRKE